MILHNDTDIQILSYPMKQFYIVSADGFKNSLLIRVKGEECLSVTRINAEDVHDIRNSFPQYMDQLRYSKNWDAEIFHKLLPRITSWLMEKFTAEETAPEVIEALKWRG